MLSKKIKEELTDYDLDEVSNAVGRISIRSKSVNTVNNGSSVSDMIVVTETKSDVF